MSTHDTLKEIQNILEENKKLQTIKTKYVDTAQTIRQLQQQITQWATTLAKLATEIDPVYDHYKTTTPKKTRRTYTPQQKDMEEIIQSISEKIMAGTDISKKTLATIYPAKTLAQIATIFLKIQRKRNIQTVKRPNTERKQSRHIHWLTAKKEASP